MAQATKAAKAVSSKPANTRKAGKPHQVSTGNSPIATLDSKMTTESARASSANVKEHPNFTGQYWLERFVTNDESEVSKMVIVRQAAKVLTAEQIKKNLDDMVEMASKIDVKAGYTKEAKDNQGKTLFNKGPTYRNASNIRSILLSCYGAIRFAPEPLKAAGFTDKTGFHAGATIARQVLKALEIKWDGTKGEAKQDREARLAMRKEEKALQQLRKDIPRQPNESLLDYERKIIAKVEHEIKRQEQEQADVALRKVVDAALNLGPEMAAKIADAIKTTLAAKAKESKQAEKTVAKTADAIEESLS